MFVKIVSFQIFLLIRLSFSDDLVCEPENTLYVGQNVFATVSCFVSTDNCDKYTAKWSYSTDGHQYTDTTSEDLNKKSGPAVVRYQGKNYTKYDFYYRYNNQKNIWLRLVLTSKTTNYQEVNPLQHNWIVNYDKDFNLQTYYLQRANGDDLEMICPQTCESTTTRGISWFKDEVNIDTDQKFLYQTEYGCTNSVITLRNVSLRDSGLYECSVNNSDKKAKFYLTIVDELTTKNPITLSKPTSTIEESDSEVPSKDHLLCEPASTIDVDEKTLIHLHCFVSQEYSLMYTHQWWITITDSTILSDYSFGSTDLVTLRKNQYVRHHIILKGSPRVAGLFRFELTPKSDFADFFEQLQYEFTVRYHENTVEKIYKYSRLVGDTFEVYCPIRLVTSEKKSILWLKDENNLLEDTRMKFANYSNGLQMVLKIENVVEQDSGEYECHLLDQSTIAKFQLTVTDELPQLSKTNQLKSSGTPRARSSKNSKEISNRNQRERDPRTKQTTPNSQTPEKVELNCEPASPVSISNEMLLFLDCLIPKEFRKFYHTTWKHGKVHFVTSSLGVEVKGEMEKTLIYRKKKYVRQRFLFAVSQADKGFIEINFRPKGNFKIQYPTLSHKWVVNYNRDWKYLPMNFTRDVGDHFDYTCPQMAYSENEKFEMLKNGVKFNRAKVIQAREGVGFFNSVEFKKVKPRDAGKYKCSIDGSNDVAEFELIVVNARRIKKSNTQFFL